MEHQAVRLWQKNEVTEYNEIYEMKRKHQQSKPG